MQQFAVKLADDAAGLGKAGQVVHLELRPSDVHDPTELSTYLAGYKPFGLRADEASPVIIVDNQSDKYRNFNEDDAFAPVYVKASTSGAIPEVDPSTTLNTYQTVTRVLGSFILKETEGQGSKAYNVRMAAARRVKRAMMLDREVDVWALLGTSTNFASAQRLALTATQNWNGGSDSDPIRDIHAAVEASAQPVTGIFLNTKAANAFLRHDKVRDFMRQWFGDASPGEIQKQAGQGSYDFSLPGLPPIHVVPGKYKPSTTLDYMLGSVAVLVTAPAGVPTDGEEIATNYTFRWKGLSGAGFDTREFEVQGRGAYGGTMVVAASSDIAVMIASNAGGIITGVYT